MISPSAQPCPPVDLAFFARPVATVARDLLGKRLVSFVDHELTTGLIVETEAYLAQGDSASHASRGLKPGNRSMFGPPGRAYVYSIHARWCFNAVTQPAGQGSAVLIRAIEPIDGVATMMRRRGVERPADLCRGPARLCQALGITRQHDGLPLTEHQPLWIDNFQIRSVSPRDIRQTPRIGVTSAQDLELRFVIADHPYASGPKRMRGG